MKTFKQFFTESTEVDQIKELLAGIKHAVRSPNAMGYGAGQGYMSGAIKQLKQIAFGHKGGISHNVATWLNGLADRMTPDRTGEFRLRPAEVVRDIDKLLQMMTNMDSDIEQDQASARFHQERGRSGGPWGWS